ncbi:MAG: hypothetical protein AB7O74_04510 [Candidatus Nanopelagicales bacterium]
MSFREKSILITIGALVVASIAYVALLIPTAAGTAVDAIPYQPLMIGMVVVLAILTAAGHIVAAIAQPKDAQRAPDEREKLIEWRGQTAGGYVLAVGVFVAIVLAMAEVPWFWIANILLGMWVLAEVFAGVWKLALLRRGA